MQIHILTTEHVLYTYTLILCALIMMQCGAATQRLGQAQEQGWWLGCCDVPLGTHTREKEERVGSLTPDHSFPALPLTTTLGDEFKLVACEVCVRQSTHCVTHLPGEPV